MWRKYWSKIGVRFIPGLLVEVRHDVLSHDVLILEVLVEIVQQRPPTLVIVHDAAQRVEEERALEIHVLRRCGIDAALRDDWLLIPDFRLVGVRVLQAIVVPVHVFDVETLEISRPAFVDPHVGQVGRADAVAEPLVPAFVDDDEVEPRADADAGPVASPR